MARIVMKFGGTSMAGTERIRRVANIVRRQAADGHQGAGVVSALAGQTERLGPFRPQASALSAPADTGPLLWRRGRGRGGPPPE